MEEIIERAIDSLNDKTLGIFTFNKKNYVSLFEEGHFPITATKKDYNQFILPFISMNTHSFHDENYLILGGGTEEILDDVIYFNVDEKIKKINSKIYKVGDFINNKYTVFTCSDEKIKNKILLIGRKRELKDFEHEFFDFNIENNKYDVIVINID